MLQAHLARCRDCRAYRERLRGIQTEAAHLETLRPAAENEVSFFEACLDRLSLEIGNDAGLADGSERILLDSMREGLYAAALEGHSPLARDLLFLEDLSDDELRFIEQEIKKEMES